MVNKDPPSLSLNLLSELFLVFGFSSLSAKSLEFWLYRFIYLTFCKIFFLFSILYLHFFFPCFSPICIFSFFLHAFHSKLGNSSSISLLFLFLSSYCCSPSDLSSQLLYSISSFWMFYFTVFLHLHTFFFSHIWSLYFIKKIWQFVSISIW